MYRITELESNTEVNGSVYIITYIIEDEENEPSLRIFRFAEITDSIWQPLTTNIDAKAQRIQ